MSALNRLRSSLSAGRGFRSIPQRYWGFIADSATATTPITAVANTWTRIPCDLQGTSEVRKLKGKNIWEPTEDRLDLAQYPLLSTVLIRTSLTLTPTSGNTRFDYRWVFPTFFSESSQPNLEGGSGNTQFREFLYDFFIGSDDILQQGGYLEVRFNSNTDIRVDGLLITVES